MLFIPRCYFNLYLIVVDPFMLLIICYLFRKLYQMFVGLHVSLQYLLVLMKELLRSGISVKARKYSKHAVSL